MRKDKTKAGPAPAPSLLEQKKQMLVTLASLAPRVQTMMRIGRAIHRCGLEYGKTPVEPQYNDKRVLVSDKDTGKVGFILRPGDGYPNTEPLAIGQLYAHGRGKHFAIDENGYPACPLKGLDRGFVNQNDKAFLRKAKAFVKGFDEFERKISEYIESLAMAG